jgi:hypothetical protein
MDISWVKAELSCPTCGEILCLRPGVAEIWCRRCEGRYDVLEGWNPRDPGRVILVLSKQFESGDRA